MNPELSKKESTVNNYIYIKLTKTKRLFTKVINQQKAITQIFPRDSFCY